MPYGQFCLGKAQECDDAAAEALSAGHRRELLKDAADWRVAALRTRSPADSRRKMTTTLSLVV